MKIKSIENNEFNIQFTVSNKCNYHCLYCPPKLNSGSTPLISIETYIRFFTDLIKDNPEIMEYEKRFVGLTGGEPTIYPGIDNLIDYFKENKFNIGLDTNGSAKMDFWEKNLSKINMTNLSVHPRYANFKHVLDIVRLGIEKKSIVKVAVIMDMENWDRAIEAVDFFKENNIPIMEFKGLVFKLGKKNHKNTTKSNDYYNSYTDEQIDWIKNNTYHNNIDNLSEINPNYQTRTAYVVYEDDTKKKFLGQEIISKDSNRFKNYQCDAGKSNLSVKWDGRITGAHCGIKRLTFGNLLENPNLKIKLLKHPIICSLEKCGCIADMRIKKSIQ
jgi:MoaA/NifB/PqqE/SkfB family radical SAM enzyme